MPPTERLRQILPFAGALYLAASVAHLQAGQPAASLPREGLSLQTVAAGIKWHMLEMAKNEQAEMAFGHQRP